MDTTIQISTRLRDAMQRRKMQNKESYESVIWDAMEDSMAINEETRRDIEKSRREVRAGKFKTLEQVKKELGA